MRELKATDKITQKMTRDGAVSENLSTGEVKHISSREPETELSASSEESAGAAADLALRAAEHHEKKSARKAEKADTQAVRDGSAARQRPSSRLQFTEEERADPALGKYIDRSDRAADRLDAAKTAIPTKKVLRTERVFDETAGKGKTQLHFEEVEKRPNGRLRHNPLSRPVHEIAHAAHAKVHEVEQENVGVEAGHKGEVLTERGFAYGKGKVRAAVHHHRTKPWRDAAKAEQASVKANAEYLYQKALHDDPALAASNPVSRFLQKQRIKRNYAKELRQAEKTAKNTAATAKSAAQKVKDAFKETFLYIKHHSRAVLLVIGIGTCVALLFGGVSSCSMMAGSGVGGVFTSSYLSEDADMLAAEAAYCELEQELQYELDHYEALHPGYDEYRFDLDEIKHDPYVLISILTAFHTQFYGQLKTIGTTKRQIKRIVRSQIFRTAVIGIPSGLIVGGIVSLGLVPFAMNMMYSSDTDLGEIVSFSPIIFAGAAIFTFFTAIIGSMKPAKIAASISPVAASRYTEANTRSYRDHKSHRTKLSRMARDNIFRNPKSAFLTFASLFLGLILFLVSAGLLSSLSPDNFVNQWGESDFALTYSISEEGNLLSDEMLQQIETMQGIENLRVTYSASPWPTMDVIYNENVFGKYIDSLDGVSGLDFSNTETRKNYTDNFWSSVYGIDSRYIEELNKTLDKPIDLTAFEKGELVVLSAMTDDEGNPLIQPGQAITVVGESGEQVFTVATGFLDADFQSGRGNERGTAPDLYISEQALEKLSGETKIFRIAFDTIDSSYDKGIMEQLQSITASSPGITILSRYEKQQEMAGYLLTSRIIAAGLSAVFLLIGIMNFINTMVVSVNTRKHEFATLESIGMTKKQIRNVLLWEGGYYWSISFLLLATLGTAIYIPIYSAFRRMVPYAAFHYPVISLLVVTAIVLLVCLATPVITFMQNVKQSVVERLRQN